ncbi:MAG: hypothetical protein IPK05_19325 [Comamonadaceae bacterium]|nr:hypothetical protein [Comamonadaceae bacterium]
MHLEAHIRAKPLMQPGCYTELFFWMNPRHSQPAIDHRAVPVIRHKLFTIAWRRPVCLMALVANTHSSGLLNEGTLRSRWSAWQVFQVAPWSDTLDGTFHLVFEGQLFPWSFSGTRTPMALTAAGGETRS